MILDDSADRDPNYWVWYNGPDVEVMTPWMQVSSAAPLGQVNTFNTNLNSNSKLTYTPFR